MPNSYAIVYYQKYADFIIEQLNSINSLLKKNNLKFIKGVLNTQFDFWLFKGVALDFKLTEKNIYLT